MNRSVLTAACASVALLASYGSTAGTAAAAAPPLKFSKWVADPSGKDTKSNTQLNRETIAVTNTTSKTIAVAGYRVKDKQGYTFVFKKGATIGAKKTVTIHTGKGTNSASHVYWNQGWYVWNNTGDTAYLQNTKGKTVFTCTYKKAKSGSKTC